MPTPEQSYWTRNAPRYNASMLILGRPLPRMLELVKAALSKDDRVLEVAAGTGIVTEAIAKKARAVIATDYSEGMIEQVSKRIDKLGLDNVHCQRADAQDLPFETHSFDAVVASNVLHLIPDLSAALASFQRVTRPGGKIIVPTFLHDETIVSRVAAEAFEITGFPASRRFTMRSLREAIENAGLRIERAERISGVIPIGYVEVG